MKYLLILFSLLITSVSWSENPPSDEMIKYNYTSIGYIFRDYEIPKNKKKVLSYLTGVAHGLYTYQSFVVETRNIAEGQNRKKNLLFCKTKHLSGEHLYKIFKEQYLKKQKIYDDYWVISGGGKGLIIIINFC